MARRSNPRRAYPRMARVNELLREVIGEALQSIDDDRLIDVTVTGVECEADLAQATVFFDVLGGAEHDADVLEALDELRPRLQRMVNAETRLKGTPRLSFSADPAIRAAARIDDVLRGLHRDEVPADASSANEAPADEAPAGP